MFNAKYKNFNCGIIEHISNGIIIFFYFFFWIKTFVILFGNRRKVHETKDFILMWCIVYCYSVVRTRNCYGSYETMLLL